MTGQQIHTANAQQSYTFASRTSQRTDPSLPKSMPAPTQEKYEVFTNTFDNKNDVSKIQNIFSSPSKKIKTLVTQTNTTKTLKLYNNNGLQEWATRTTGYNKVLPKVGLNGFNWTFVQCSTFVLRLTFSAKNPRLRQYLNRKA